MRSTQRMEQKLHSNSIVYKHVTSIPEVFVIITL